MLCAKCGAENPSDAKVCASCGAELEASKQPKSAIQGKLKELLHNKTVLSVAIIAAAAIVLIILLCSIFSGSKGDFVYDNQSILLVNGEEDTTLVIGGKAQKARLEGNVKLLGDASLDGKVAVATTVGEEENFLYIINGSKIKKINGSENYENCTIAASGDAVAYTVVDGDEENLYLYKVSSGKSTKLDGAVYANSGSLGINNLIVSPDGKSVCYTIDRLSGEDYSSASYYAAKSPVKLGSGLKLFGMSNGGKYIYAVSGEENNLFTYNNKGEKKTKLGAGVSNIRFNKDHTQLLFESKDSTYISVNGKEGVRFFKDRSISLLTPRNVRAMEETYPVKSFYNQLFVSESNVYLVNKNYDKSEKLVSKVDGQIQLSTDCSSIYYIDKGELKMIRTSWGDRAPEKEVTIVGDCDYYVLTADCSKVYYIDGQDFMSANAKNGKSRKTIESDIDLAEFRWAISHNDVLYYISSGDLYATDNGKAGKRVLSDVVSLSRDGDVIYATNDSKDVYASTGSKKLKKIYSAD